MTCLERGQSQWRLRIRRRTRHKLDIRKKSSVFVYAVSLAFLYHIEYSRHFLRLEAYSESLRMLCVTGGGPPVPASQATRSDKGIETII